MLSESQERMLCVVRAGAGDEVLAIFDKWDLDGAAIGARHRHRPMRVLATASSSATSRARRSPTSARVRRAASARPRRSTPRPSRPLARRRRRLEALLALLALAEHRLAEWVFHQYDHGRASRTVRRPEEADAAVVRAARTARATRRCRTDCNGRRFAARSLRGHVAAVPSAPQPRVHGRRAARRHRLPQLRQPRAARGDVAARRGHPRPRRRLPRARDAGRAGQRLALQRGRRGSIYPTPMIGMVGRLPDARRAVRLGFADEGTRSRSSAVAPVAGASELREAPRRVAARSPARRRPRGGRARRSRPCASAVRARAARRRPRLRRGRARAALAECCVAGGIGAEIGLDELLQALATDLERSCSRSCCTAHSPRRSSARARAASSCAAARGPRRSRGRTSVAIPAPVGGNVRGDHRSGARVLRLGELRCGARRGARGVPGEPGSGGAARPSLTRAPARGGRRARCGAFR